ncbi:MAG: hypothetical protein HYX42_04065 [Polaromonas sp.]|uniref:hypothetical protein n=1 Tax=Polaromonas sp. TaxID=1869339 RepID=UPI0025FF2DD3|nr:hypothetical protein [Polaromonas sp.]MBI2725406.1 hypothetical protein [Polaromonas sp.]
MKSTKVQESAEKKLPPNAGKGRKAGVPNKTTAVLKDAILAAAVAVGYDGNGQGGLTGYLKLVASSDVKAFAGLLGKVLPLQITGEGGGPVVIAASATDERL